MTTLSTDDPRHTRTQHISNTEATIARIQHLHHKITQSRTFSVALGRDALQMSLAIEHERLIIKSHVLLATIYIAKGNTTKSLDHLKEVEDQIYSEKYDDYPTLRRFHSNYAAINSHLDRHWDTIKHYKKAYQIACHIQDLYSQRICLLNLGFAYTQIGDWDRAIDYLRQSNSLPHEAHHLTLAALAYLADIFEIQEQWEAAYPYRKQVADQYSDNEPVYGSVFYNDLALTQAHLKMFESSWKSIEKARSLLIGSESAEVAKAKIDIVEGYWHLLQGNLNLAESCYHHAIVRLRIKDNPRIVRKAKILKGRVLFKRGEYEACIEWFDTIRDDNMPELARRRIYKLKAEAYAHLGEWKEAYDTNLKLQEIISVDHTNLHMLYRLQEESYRHEVAKQSNSILRSKNAELEMLHGEKDEMLRIVAHDLKNPISALHLTLHVLQKSHHHFTEQQVNDRLATCLSTVDRINAIVTQLTAIGELESHLLNAVSEPLPILPEIKQIIRDQEELARSKQQKIELQAGTDLLIGYIHEQCFAQAISNLISNAIKYSPFGSTIQVIVAPTADGYIRIDIIDEGQGLTKNDKALLFKKYAKLSAKPTGNESSTGLGLYIVKRLVEAMGGTISAASPGKDLGSTFSVLLPMFSGHSNSA